MNPEFVWAIIVIVVALILGGAAIGLYFFWKDEKDYDENKKLIVWSIAIAAIITVICGILLLIWGIYKRGHMNVAKRTAKQNEKLAARAAKRNKLLTSQHRTDPGKLTMVPQAPKTLAPPKPIAFAGKGETSRSQKEVTSLQRRKTIQLAKKGDIS